MEANNDQELLEISRHREGETASEVSEVLTRAGIPFRMASTAPCFDITTIGGGGNEPEVIISVYKSDFHAAREVMEEEFLNSELPEDHYLFSSSDDELAEMLGKPSEWSPMVVAHARKLAAERGIDTESIERKKIERIRALEYGKPASKTLLFLGWMFSLIGGAAGIGIALSIYCMKEKTPEGEYFTYDAKSRDIGKCMLLVSVLVLGLCILLRACVVEYP